jgi:uncharacterized membrane protein (DUF2068 family)
VAVAAIVAMEGLAMVGIAVFFVLEVLTAGPDDPVRAWVTALLAAASAAGLVLTGRGLLLGRRWARAPALVSNLLLLPVSASMLRGGLYVVGVPLLALGLSVLVLLFTRPVTEALDDGD